MYIKALALNGFRNYDELIYTPSEGLNLIYGNNAQGKTSILESIFLCAFGRSQRTVHDEELIKHEKDFCAVKARICSENGGEHSIGVFIGSKKTVEIDNEPIKRMSDLMGILKVVMFSPESLSLVKGSPAERRRFMDMCISQLSRSYFCRLQQYNSILKQRNALLKSPDVFSNRDYMEMWDEQLITAGSYIMTARKRFIYSMLPVVYKTHHWLSGGNDSLRIEYAPSVNVESEDEIRTAFSQRLKESFEDDIRRGSTGIGIHKDDVSMKTNDMDTRTFASQGQQRTAALAIRLSEIDFIRRISGESPVVLLDDVFSELDEVRCNSLMNYVKGCQCIFTSAQKLPDGLSEGVMAVKCDDGRVKEVGQSLL